MPKGQTYKKEKRERRLANMEAYFQMQAKAEKPYYPTVTQIAKAYGVTTPIIYRDLEHLRLKLGPFIVPALILGSKKDGDK